MIYFEAGIRNAAACTDDAVTTSSVGIPVKLALAPAFDGLAKTLVFSDGTTSVDVVLVGDAAEAMVPADVLTTAGRILQMGIYAADGDGNIVIPTVWASVAAIQKGTVPAGVDPDDPTPNWVAQVQEMASEALEAAEAVEAAAQAGEFDGADGYSPTVSVEDIPGGHRVTITDEGGEHSFDVMDGQGGGGGGGTPYDSDPEALGSASPGTSDAYARGNHVHPKPTPADIGAGTYSKPAGGIPKTDLAGGVQSSLDKADAALPKAGGTMSGALAMGGNKITGLGAGENPGDAVNFGQMASAISQSAAYFRGSFASRAALLAVAWQTTDPDAAYYVTNNDYAIVLDDETQDDECWRYLYVGGAGWTAQYRINETPLTQAQMDALNSGATAAAIAQISTNTNAIAGKLAANQGAGNAGKFLVVGSDGVVVPVTMQVWNGGSF